MKDKNSNPNSKKGGSMLSTFSENFKAVRTAQGFSQNKLAVATGFTQSYISQTEKLGKPSAQFIKKCAEAMSVPETTISIGLEKTVQAPVKVEKKSIAPKVKSKKVPSLKAPKSWRVANFSVQPSEKAEKKTAPKTQAVKSVAVKKVPAVSKAVAVKKVPSKTVVEKKAPTVKIEDLTLICCGVGKVLEEAAKFLKGLNKKLA